MKRSYKPECSGWYEKRLHLGLPIASAKGFVYAWHEEGEPHQCKIGYCTKEPFDYLWNGKVPHQKRLPVVFLTVGASTDRSAKEIEGLLHQQFELQHMIRSCAREWFDVEKATLCDAATALVRRLEVEGAL